MKKQINHHKDRPNFILPDQGILHCFKGSIRDFSARMSASLAPARTEKVPADFLIIDNDTGEIIKA